MVLYDVYSPAGNLIRVKRSCSDTDETTGNMLIQRDRTPTSIFRQNMRSRCVALHIFHRFGDIATKNLSAKMIAIGAKSTTSLKKICSASYMVLLTLSATAAFTVLYLLRKRISSTGNRGLKVGTLSYIDVDRHVLIVDLRDSFLPQTTKLAAQACAGLYNRKHDEVVSKNYPFVYTLLHDPDDESWLKQLKLDSEYHFLPLIHPYKTSRLNGNEFLLRCLQEFPRRVRYRYYGPARRVVPNVLTMGSLLEAIPLQDGDPVFDIMDPKSLPIVFDAITHSSFARNSEHDATQYVYNTYAGNTTTIAKINPGYGNTSFYPWSSLNNYGPPLVHDMDISLIDFIYSERLFAFYLFYGCVKWWNPGPHKDSYNLVMKMAEDRAGGRWPNPVPVYGYDDSWTFFGGDIFEAETMCVASHNFGQIATHGVNNLSFFSRWSNKVVKGEINTSNQMKGAGLSMDVKDTASSKSSDELRLESGSFTGLSAAYDKNKTYVALVVGDGDNILYMKGTRADWMRERKDHCIQSSQADMRRRCFPLSWTISSHLANIAPDILRWYVEQASLSSNSGGEDFTAAIDTFVLPPSGHLYAYPGLMPDDVQDKFIEETEMDAEILNISTTVDWEWFTSWSSTEANFYPKYTKRGIIRGIFTVNVPYVFPTDRFLPTSFFKVIHPPEGSEGNPVVMFKPREWRGSPEEQKSCNKVTEDYLSPAELANEIGAYPRGTVAYIYLTSDGGLSFNDISQLAKMVPDHVNLVNTETATSLALFSHRMHQSSKVKIMQERENVIVLT